MASRESRPRYETRDADVSAIFRIGFLLFALIVLVVLLTWFLYERFLERTPGEAVFTDVVDRPRRGGPELELSPAWELERRRARERELLETYGWVDRERGIVRIPIERAMERVLERGLPLRAPDKSASGEAR